MSAMHIVDSTLFFAPHSDGLKRYLTTKHRYLASVRGIRHTLLVPGARRATDFAAKLGKPSRIHHMHLALLLIA